MRRSISLIILLITCSLASADIPKDHWAEKSVYKLIKLGVISGYPDGTFRGLKNMTRAEMAACISKLGEKADNYSEAEKVLAELKAEFASYRYEMENPDTPQISGDYTQRAIIGNPTTSGPHGPKMDYRLKLSLYEKMGESASIRANLDTVDAGFGGVTRDLLLKMVDAEGRFKAGSINYYAKAGSGTIVHREKDGINYSDDYTIFIHPKTSLGAQTYWQNLDLSLDYVTRQVNSFGYVGVNEVTGKIGYTFRSFPLLGKTVVSLRPRHLWNSTIADNLAELNVINYPTPVISFDTTLGAGHTAASSGLYAKLIGKIETNRTRIKLIGYKVGNTYRCSIDKYEFIPLNEFNKLVLDGTTDVALTLSHMFTDYLSVDLKSGMTTNSAFKYGKDHPGTTMTTEYALNFVMNPQAYLRTFYRSYAVPSGISSPDPTMAVAVPELSDIFGLEVKIKI